MNPEYLSLVNTALHSDIDSPELPGVLDRIRTQLSQGDSTSLPEGRSWSSNGILISPRAAARCFQGGPRTVKYLRAVYRALQHPGDGEFLDVVYPGCGPYGTLVVPLLPLFSDAKIRITFIDVHQASIDHLEKIISSMGLSRVQCRFRCMNAMDYLPENKIDLLVLECLIQGLRDEGQVAITTHLSPYLAQSGRLIPRQIIVRANWIDPVAELSYVHQCRRAGADIDPLALAQFRIPVGKLLSLDRHTHQRLDSEPAQIHLPEFRLPEKQRQGQVLGLCTTLDLDAEFRLDEYEDGITHPCYPSYSGELSPGTLLKLVYKTGSRPGFVPASD
ncbi:MAG TPA: hypothetical protein DHV36_04755 [Desulfobacteraceae bacterium]|nr:hypothetical protein [Desulfobacteraceae bacterium]